MIAGKINDWSKFPGFQESPVWNEAFQWIEKNAADSEEGIFPLQSQGCFVRVMSYNLKSREEANYESHLETIDLQFTIEGGEGIEVTSVDGLVPRGEYLDHKDFQFYETPLEESTFIQNREGCFCVLFPEDGHQPQRAFSDFTYVRKLVVKIPRSSL